MKKQILTLAALAGLAVGATLANAAYNPSTGGSAGGGIVDSKHNMNLFLNVNGTTKFKDAETRICAFCHTPHHAYGAGQSVAITDSTNDVLLDAKGNPQANQNPISTYNVYAPLWSRDLSKLQMNGYDSYESATFSPGTYGKAYDNLIGPSRLCLTCHDGQIAADAYYGDLGTATIAGSDDINMFGNGNFAVAKDRGLSNDHPIGMKYKDFLDKTDGATSYELNPVTTRFAKAGQTLAKDTYAGGTGKAISEVLWVDPTSGINSDNAFVTCASCHDVHNGPAVGNTNPATTGRGYFLYGTQYNSYFCLTCHKKNSTN